jgi:hypothetical protein
MDPFEINYVSGTFPLIYFARKNVGKAILEDLHIK